MTLFEKYSEKFYISKEKYEQACALFPNGVCHDARNFPPFPFVSSKASGAFLDTVEGVRLLDLWSGHYGNILGSASKETADALIDAAETGTHTGVLNDQQIRLASLIKEAIPEMELMRFCTSGTEATMYACRTAKAYTGRDLILKIEGGWHGGNIELSHDIRPPFGKSCAVSGTVALPFNNLEATENLLKQVAYNAAAIIIEPVIGSGIGIPAKEEYLKLLRSFCDKTGTVLIFDEVITGFRFRFGSVAPLLGVMPDMFTMGKIIGGGLAIGAYGGKREIMHTIEEKNLLVGGGTFSATPVSMSAGFNTLTALKNCDYELLNSTGDAIREKIASSMAKYTDKVHVTGVGSVLFMHFLNTPSKSISDKSSDFLSFVDRETEKLFKIALILEGVYSMHSGGALSFAHLKIDKLSEKLEDAYRNSIEAVLDEKGMVS